MSSRPEIRPEIAPQISEFKAKISPKIRSKISPESDPKFRPFWQRSALGAVRIYTRRHINGCRETSPDSNTCSCPKWIYAKPVTGAARQIAARTPSFAEAREIGQRTLEGFNVGVRKERKESAARQTTIKDALALYTQVLRTRRVSESYIKGTVEPTFVRRPTYKRGRRVVCTSLLDFLDRYNRKAIETISRVAQIETAIIDEWHSLWTVGDLTAATWRNVTKSFFLWCYERGMSEAVVNFSVSCGHGRRGRGRSLVKKGNRCGYFKADEYLKIVNAIPFYQPSRGFFPANYATRLRAFVELGRWGGMAGCDLVRFSPGENLDGDTLRYQRLKTTETAVVALPHGLAERLRHIPPEKDSAPGDRPFRLADCTEKRNRGIWRDRFQKLCHFAGIPTVETQVGRTINTHPHMLRDTFAIDLILRGVKLENVSRCLGHATTEMTQRAYIYWIKQRDDFSLNEQRAALTGVTLPPEYLPVVGGRRTLVH